MTLIKIGYPSFSCWLDLCFVTIVHRVYNLDNYKGNSYEKQLSQLMPTLVVLILILALTVATYNTSLKQEEEECWNRLENASEAIIQSIQSRVNDDLNYLRLIGKDFSNEDHLLHMKNIEIDLLLLKMYHCLNVLIY